MKSIASLALVAATLFFAGSNAADDNLPSQGCFSSTLGLKVLGTTDIYTTKGSCKDQCNGADAGYTVFGLTNSTWCYCGTTIPPTDTKVANSSCNTPCPGYPDNICGGGKKYTSVYLLLDSLQGTVFNINDDGTTPSSTTVANPAHTASTTASVVTVVNGQTVYVTPTSAATGKSSGGASKAAIAAGVIVGLIAIAAIAGGVFLFLRSKQRREVEEEYKRNAAISQVSQGGRHPSSSGGGSTFSDMRLDPAVMAQRRMSDGSIADNQDYSRRILKVTNA